MLEKYTLGHIKKRQDFLREAEMRRVNRGVVSLGPSVNLEAGSSGQTWVTALHRTSAASSKCYLHLFSFFVARADKNLCQHSEINQKITSARLSEYKAQQKEMHKPCLGTGGSYRA